MAMWEEAHWESRVDSGVPRAEQRSGSCRRYVPDLLNGAGLAISGEVSRQVNTVERSLRALNGPGAEGLAGIARFLLRSEAIASSRIEGIAPSAQQVALAELGQSETVRGVSEQAQLVANNMTVVREATTRLVEADLLTVADIVELQRALLPDEPRHHGLRTVQTLARILDVSFPAASAALDELKQAGILTTRSIERGATAYFARDVLDLITFSERALASIRFDTRTSPPNRAVPAMPQVHPSQEKR